jgi:DNA polymerase
MPHEIDDPLRRGVLRHLESLRLAGLPHLPRSYAVPEPEAEPLLGGGCGAARAGVAEPGDNSNADPWQALRERVSACARCRELADTRTQTVFGVGDPKAELMFIGEAPGADEDKKGEPFVGMAGQLLNKIIEVCGWQRREIYICNVLKCRPPGNRTPTPAEAANCREYLDGQISLVDPSYIVCWGAVAAQNLLGSTQSIGRMRGKFYSYRRAKVLCTYHPSYLLRNPAAKRDVWDDMKLLLAEMGRPVP